MPVFDKGRVTARKALNRACAQIGSRFEQAAVKVDQSGVERQNHKGR